MTTEQLIQSVLAYGKTDEGYLRWHANRFIQTHALYCEHHDLQAGLRVLDIGAHWLHQALVYARQGCRVTAVDVGGVFAVDSVRALAADHGIELHNIADLSREDVFDHLPESHFDVVLFTETIEHITYNPVAMWQAIHRVMKPGGRVILTTPNYYFWDSRAWDWKRFFNRMGGGIPVEDIIKLVTYGHHWKEFSARELVRYFSLLPAAFYIARLEYVSMNAVHRAARCDWKYRLFSRLEQRVGFLRDTLYGEVVCRK